VLKIRRSAKATSDITIASMSDIAFLLIIFFLVTSVFIIKEGMHLVMPDRDREPVTVSSADVITITMTADSRIIADGKKIGKDALAELIRSSHEKYPETYVLLKISGDVSYELAVELIDLAKTAGMKKLSIKTF